MYFAYIQNLSINVPHNFENYIKPVGACGNFISKCLDISGNRAPLLVHTVIIPITEYKSYSPFVIKLTTEVHCGVPKILKNKKFYRD